MGAAPTVAPTWCPSTRRASNERRRPNADVASPQALRAAGALTGSRSVA